MGHISLLRRLGVHGQFLHRMERNWLKREGLSQVYVMIKIVIELSYGGS